MVDKTYTHKSIGADLIELPEEYIPGSVEISGYIVNEVGGTNLIIVNPTPSIDEEVVIKYKIAEKIKKTTPAKKVVEDKIIEDLIKTVAIQQETINELQSALKNRVTYQHLDAVTKHLASQLSLIKTYLDVE